MLPEINLQMIPPYSQIVIETIRAPRRRLWLFELARVEPSLINPVQFSIKPSYGVSRNLPADLIGIFHASANDGAPPVNTLSDMVIRAGDILHLRALNNGVMAVVVDSLMLDGRPAIDREVEYKIWLGQTAYYHEIRDILLSDGEPQEFCRLWWRLNDDHPLTITRLRAPELPYIPQRLFDAITRVELTDIMVADPPYHRRYYDEADHCTAEIEPNLTAEGRAWSLKVTAPSPAAALHYRQRVLIDETATPLSGRRQS